MSFSEKLNNYMEEYELSSAQLTAVTGLSKSTISRFRSGKQEPPPYSDTLNRLATGIAELIGAEKDTIYTSLLCELKSQAHNFDHISTNLNILISALDINASDLSRFLNYDASYLSRIRSGQRKPANIFEFCNSVATFTANHYSDNITSLAMLMDCNEEDIKNDSSLKLQVFKWLSEGTQKSPTQPIRHFLEEVDRFDLNEYIRAIHYDQIRTPTIPFSIPNSRVYFTLNGFMKAELDWIKSTVLSPSAEPVIMYSDMPMEEMAKHNDFAKKVVGGMAMMLKKGLHLNVIHNIERSFNEMMLGLEGWIPLYMTGQVSPYYFKGRSDNVFHHFIRVSGAAALSGEAIKEKHNNGKYYLTRKKDEIEYYRLRAEDMISRATPLMEIFRENSQNEFKSFLKNDHLNHDHNYRNILSAPPLYTISQELLSRILDNNNISGEKREKILDHYRTERESFFNLIEKNSITDEILMPSFEEFRLYPNVLPLADIFLEKEIYYTYDTYCEHIELTKGYAKSNESYNCIITKGQLFRNIQIRIAKGSYAIISKNIAPAIHFVVRHQKLRQAIEHISFFDC